MAKYSRYQDYVIANGKFVGEFEEMYQDFGDPWEQSSREAGRSEKTLAIYLCRKYGFRSVLELGCGLGHFSNEIQKAGLSVTGVDVSQTAIRKATAAYPKCSFLCGDILDFQIYEENHPDCIILSEITWYVLDKLDDFLSYYKKASWNKVKPYLLHLLTLYPEGVQQYGKQYFSDLKGILTYFSLDYEEYGQITYKDLDWASRTYFLAKA